MSASRLKADRPQRRPLSAKGLTPRRLSITLLIDTVKLLRSTARSRLRSILDTVFSPDNDDDSPLGQSTAATMNPGFANVAVTWQIAAEAIVPPNREGGNGMGFRAQLLFFIDDLLPSLFGKPLLTDKPERSLIAWH